MTQRDVRAEERAGRERWRTIEKGGGLYQIK